MSFQEYASSVSSRLHLGDVNRRMVAGIGAIAAAVALCAIGLLASQDGADAAGEAEPLLVEVAQEPGEPDVPDQIYVHVGGSVNSPGIVLIDSGSRVADAVMAAGGLRGDAASDSINLARALEDGEQVIVPSVEDMKAMQPSVQGTVAGSAGMEATAEGPSKVNINTASVSELQSLNGIGESKAAKIVAHREQNGPFSTIEDLKGVSGIGDKTFESLKDSICVK